MTRAEAERAHRPILRAWIDRVAARAKATAPDAVKVRTLQAAGAGRRCGLSILHTADVVLDVGTWNPRDPAGRRRHDVWMVLLTFGGAISRPNAAFDEQLDGLDAPELTPDERRRARLFLAA